MTPPQNGIRAQLRNVEQATRTTIDAWVALIGASGLTKHTDVVAMLKRDHGLAHGAAHRLSLVAREGSQTSEPATSATERPHLGPDP